MGNNLTILKLFAKVEVKREFHTANSSVLITGGGSGIGRGLALSYAKRNCISHPDRLTLVDRAVADAEQVARECQSAGCKEVIVVQADVTVPADCKSAIEAAIARFQTIDILVLCAGIAAHQLFEGVKDLDVYRKLMDVNYFGYVNCTYYAYPYLKQSKGQIVVLSSISGEIGLPFRTAYCASKFAVTGFFEALRSEFDQEDVAITLICPPSVRTNLRKNSIVQVADASDNENRIEVEECVDSILAAADRRARKIFFPFKVYFAVYVRPFFPDFVDKKLKRAAKL
jgi:short-subunit dehydrogenase